MSKTDFNVRILHLCLCSETVVSRPIHHMCVFPCEIWGTIWRWRALSLHFNPAELGRCTQLLNGCRLSQDILELREAERGFNCTLPGRILTAVALSDHKGSSVLHYSSGQFTNKHFSITLKLKEDPTNITIYLLIINIVQFSYWLAYRTSNQESIFILNALMYHL